MGELDFRRPSSGRLPNKQDRAHGRELDAIVRRTQRAATEVDAEAAFSGRLMERVVDIDGYRRALAGNDETLNQVLTRIELGFIAKAERMQRSFGSEFGL